MSIFEHHRFEIWNQSQHPYKHSLTDLAYTNNALNGVTTAQGALDYILAVLYPNNKEAVANVAALPAAGNTINDYRVVLDDGDGKAAGYRWELREGEAGTGSWHKIYDVDFGAGTYLAQAYENYQDLFVQKFGNDDLDAAGAAVTGTLAGQTIFGGKSASTNLTLKANSGDGTGAATGYVQFGDNNRPTADNTFALGTSALRYTSLFALALNAGASGLTISSNSLTQLTFSSSGGLPYITSSGRFEFGTFCGVGGASSNLAAMTSGITNPLNQTRQWGYYAALASTSAATHATLSTVGYYSAVTTAASAFTAPNRYQFFGEGSTAKGAGSTITHDAIYGGSATTQGGTSNAFLKDTAAPTAGSYGLYLAGTTQNYLAGPLAHANTTVASAATITALSSASNLINFSGSTATSIQGITAPQNSFAMPIYLISIGANLTIANENAGATAANRITTNTGADVAITAPGAATLVYNSVTSRWVLLSSAA